ncbi:MAG: hypothetical protein ACLP0J_28950 [Solirubrobacteraceae bacterium]
MPCALDSVHGEVGAREQLLGIVGRSVKREGDPYTGADADAETASSIGWLAAYTNLAPIALACAPSPRRPILTLDFAQMMARPAG